MKLSNLPLKNTGVLGFPDYTSVCVCVRREREWCALFEKKKQKNNPETSAINRAIARQPRLDRRYFKIRY